MGKGKEMRAGPGRQPEREKRVRSGDQGGEESGAGRWGQAGSGAVGPRLALARPVGLASSGLFPLFLIKAEREN